MKRALIVSQAIPQWYVDLLEGALGENYSIDIITGSNVEGNIIKSPKHNAENIKSRLVCWIKHYCFVKKWCRRNRKKSYDIIFATSNPPINSMLGLQLKKKYKCRLYYMNWDLYPQVIEKNFSSSIVKFICRIWNLWNDTNYPKIDQMLTIGEVVAESLVAPLSRPLTVKIMPIAVDTNFLKPIAKCENPFCVRYDLVDKFVVLYSGKMGFGHNIEIILQAAEVLKNHEKLKFVFIGEGPKFDIINEHIKRHGSKNILLLPLQPIEEFKYSMACGDIGIVSQEKEMASLFLPSKVYSMMACGEAIIGLCSLHDDLSGIIKKENIGKVVASLSVDELVEAVLDLYNNEELLAVCKENARNAVVKKYSLDIIEEKYKEMFEKDNNYF